MRHDARPNHRTHHAGFTLLEVAVVALLSALLISGLAAASMHATRSNLESARIGAPERAIQQALERISNDLRSHGHASAFGCGASGTLSVDGMPIAWRTERARVNANGSLTSFASCGSEAERHTLRVVGRTLTDGVVHERETVISLVSAVGRPRIEWFIVTPNPARLRPGEDATFSWRLTADSPAGTVTYLNGDSVPTDPNTRSGSATRAFAEGMTVELVAEAIGGSDSRAIEVHVGTAPIIRALGTTPNRYTPGQTLTLNYTIDPQELRLTAAQADPSFAATRTINVGSNQVTPLSGSQTFTVPAATSGPITFTAYASNTGGSSQRTIRVQECPLPSITLSAPASVSGEGYFSRNVTVSWTTSNASQVSFQRDSHAPVTVPANGSRSEHVSVVHYPGTTTYTWTVRATSDCGRNNSQTTTTRVIAEEPSPPPPPPPPGGGDDGGACVYVPGQPATACSCEDLGHELNLGSPECVFWFGWGSFPNGCTFNVQDVCDGDGGGGGGSTPIIEP